MATQVGYCGRYDMGLDGRKIGISVSNVIGKLGQIEEYSAYVNDGIVDALWGNWGLTATVRIASVTFRWLAQAREDTAMCSIVMIW